MCQGCVHEGRISQEMFDGIEAFLARYPNAEYGPGHIVLADCNVEVEHIWWCLGLLELALTAHQQVNIPMRYLPRLSHEDHEMFGGDYYASLPTEELVATYTFLQECLLPLAKGQKPDLAVY